VLPDSFIVEEEESMIATIIKVRKNDRPTDGGTELIALESCPWKAVEVIRIRVGIERIIADELIDCAVK
jgi:hypothetical protein